MLIVLGLKILVQLNLDNVTAWHYNISNHFEEESLLCEGRLDKMRGQELVLKVVFVFFIKELKSILNEQSFSLVDSHELSKINASI